MTDKLADIGRNEFDEWCWRRGLDLRATVAGLEAAAAQRAALSGEPPERVPSIETVRLVRLPFTDARRRVPSTELIHLINAMTGGEIMAAHFYPPHLRGAAQLTTSEDAR